jgi:hypothetical protein
MATNLAGVENVTPRDLGEFLDDIGWRREAEQPRWLGDSGELWASPGRTQELILPLNASFADYPRVVAEACNSVAAFLDVEPPQVLRRVLAVPFDVIRLRVDPGDARPTLQLGDAMALVTGARSMMAATAASAVAPLPHYGSRRPPEAESYVRRLQMAHTERGSFVVVIHSPIGRVLPQGGTQRSFDSEMKGSGVSEPEPLTGRTIAVGMVDALDAAQDAARLAVRERDVEVFEQTVTSGVSANLCSALAELSGVGDDDEQLGISVDWSPRLPLDVDDEFDGLSERPIEGGYRTTFIEAASYLRSLDSLEAVQVVGSVRTLKRSPGEFIGEATLRAMVAGSPKSVKVLLPIGDYQAAIAAHEQERNLSVTGALRREGRSLVMDAPSDVRVV